ncbi:hypothetical protein Nepgr_009657 [Nepenthes gracilis]|uniref:Uncharacterized protein n=1 Tax=Nepenthes gracilis TaxID=150966 RepID=A0AAD3SBP4_NEPGR|nr:hypothetical protein Nepgr_009657 [Nepenthes gracilis]
MNHQKESECRLCGLMENFKVPYDTATEAFLQGDEPLSSPSMAERKDSVSVSSRPMQCPRPQELGVANLLHSCEDTQMCKLLCCKTHA